jgi:hypothetical protein
MEERKKGAGHECANVITHSGRTHSGRKVHPEF